MAFYAGAGGTTATEMRAALHLGVPDAQVATEYARLDAASSRRADRAGGRRRAADGRHCVRGLGGQEPVYEQPFLDMLSAGLRRAAQASRLHPRRQRRDRRDQCVGEHEHARQDSEHRRRERGQRGDAHDPRERGLLQRSWAQSFPPAQPLTFTDAHGATSTIPMMEQQTGMYYTGTSDYQAVLVPYARTAAALLVIAAVGDRARRREGEPHRREPHRDARRDEGDGRRSHDADGASPGVVRLQRRALEALGMKGAFDRDRQLQPGDHGRRALRFEVYQRTPTDITEQGTAVADDGQRKPRRRHACRGTAGIHNRLREPSLPHGDRRSPDQDAALLRPDRDAATGTLELTRGDVDVHRRHRHLRRRQRGPQGQRVRESSPGVGSPASMVTSKAAPGSPARLHRGRHHDGLRPPQHPQDRADGSFLRGSRPTTSVVLRAPRGSAPSACTPSASAPASTPSASGGAGSCPSRRRPIRRRWRCPRLARGR